MITIREQDLGGAVASLLLVGAIIGGVVVNIVDEKSADKRVNQWIKYSDELREKLVKAHERNGELRKELELTKKA